MRDVLTGINRESDMRKFIHATNTLLQQSVFARHNENGGQLCYPSIDIQTPERINSKQTHTSTEPAEGSPWSARLTTAPPIAGPVNAPRSVGTMITRYLCAQKVVTRASCSKDAHLPHQPTRFVSTL